MLNNRKCNYPSASIKPGDVIQVRDRSRKMEKIMESMKRIKGDIELPWLELDKSKMSGTFLAVPERDEMALTVNEQLVVELYSK
jgi:small subunit ribosomal protein S4